MHLCALPVEIDELLQNKNRKQINEFADNLQKHVPAVQFADNFQNFYVIKYAIPSIVAKNHRGLPF